MSLTYRTPWQAAAHDIAAGRAADPAWPARLLDGWREEARRLRDEVRASGGTIALHADADRAGPDQATDAIARLVARLPGHMELLGELDALAADPPGPRQAAHPPRSGEATRRPGAKVAIPLPCFNDGLWLPDAVASAEAQTIPVHLVIADDGSTDPLTRLAMECLERAGFHVVRLPENAGQPAALNAAIAVTACPYILPLDADNAIEPAYAGLGAGILDREPGTGVVYGDVRLTGKMTGRWRPGEFDLARVLNHVDHSAVLRREIWERAGGYGAVGGRGEDWHMWLCACEQGWDLRYVPEVMLTYRVRDGQKSSRWHHDAGPVFREAVERIFAQHPGLYAERIGELLPGIAVEMKRLHLFGHEVSAALDAAQRDAREANERCDSLTAELEARAAEVADLRERLSMVSREHAAAAAVARRLESELADERRLRLSIERTRAVHLARHWWDLRDRVRRRVPRRRRRMAAP